MAVNEQRIRQHLKSFDILKLFNELGWDRLATPYSAVVSGVTYALTPLAEKRGMVALLCPPLDSGETPDYKLRGQIEKEITKHAHKHIIVYLDAAKTTQIWQWARREKGRPIARREHTFKKSQSGDALVQKLRNIGFSLDEEEDLSHVVVTGRARAAFDIEKVTKRFYDLFKTEHTNFLGFIKGIALQGDREWYASVMLNRLMFIYFIQKKKFLDGDPDYLRNRLTLVRSKQGSGQFHNFYRSFLLRLFHEGLGERQRSAELEELIGSVPYLNGGIFSPHQLEQNEKNKIDIADEAFQGVFDFFDKYQWHLDDRPLKNDNEINPDVLGFIFEKYINQKQMGAYYTKEDITEYIGRNTIIPYLFDAACDECRIAFEPQGSVWRLPKERPERYIFDAVAKGHEIPLPPEIEAGIGDVAKRGDWNQPAASEYALPTEIWRETVARRKRHAEVRAKLVAGEVTSINDFITYNLDLRQLTEDAITESEGPELLRAFWKALTTVRILDPTVGSGAFLFAALNILEPLYEACLNRMEAFVEESDRVGDKSATGRPGFADLRATLKQVSDHRDRRYHIYKSIIVNNLYGVDIMEEATEICKLRLFLKLVSVIEKVDDIEPLPDIDFNIRSGNTLVGYATREELRKAVEGDEQGKLGFDDDVLKVIEHKATLIDQQFIDFREAQTKESEIAKGDLGHRRKRAIQTSLDELRSELDLYMAKQYGQGGSKSALAKWKESHRPFHWFAEFYGVLKDGGFDVIIGNPPYVGTKKIGYPIPKSYVTASCKDLFALTTERLSILLKKGCFTGIIIPLSATSTDTMSPLRNLIAHRSSRIWTSYYSASDQPSSLFSGVRHRLLILLSIVEPNDRPIINTTRFLKWFSDERPNLFNALLQYESSNQFCKISTPVELSVLTKISKDRPLSTYFRPRGVKIYYHNAPVHWGKVFNFIPHYSVAGVSNLRSSHLKDISFLNAADAAIAICALSSTLYYWYNWQYSNCRDLSMKDVGRFPLSIERMNTSVKRQLTNMSQSLMDDLNEHKRIYRRVSDNVESVFDAFYPAKSKAIIDEIDHLLAKHYGFTEEETDFIINYDIKYRMGRGADAEED